MKPVGLTNPRDPKVKAHAIVQLRQDNALGTLFNMVGFQTKLKYGAQTDIFRMIPGLQNAQFARLGGLHRNTFLNSPKLLDRQLRLKAMPRLRFAGQVTGVEGYVESAAMGLLAGRLAAAQALGRDLVPPPPETAMGALVEHITGGHLEGVEVPADEHQLRPAAAAGGAARGRRGQEDPAEGPGAGEEAADERAGAGGAEGLAGRNLTGLGQRFLTRRPWRFADGHGPHRMRNLRFSGLSHDRLVRRLRSSVARAGVR